MARKLVDSAKVQKFAVQGVALAAARMVTVKVDDALWACAKPSLTAPGTFVRLCPPPGVSKQQVDSLRESLLEHGALAVRIVRANNSDVLPQQALQDQVVPKALPGIRDVVGQLVREANTPDKAALEQLVDGVMAEVGL
jgi:hypothetical protein